MSENVTKTVKGARVRTIGKANVVIDPANRMFAIYSSETPEVITPYRKGGNTVDGRLIVNVQDPGVLVQGDNEGDISLLKWSDVVNLRAPESTGEASHQGKSGRKNS